MPIEGGKHSLYSIEHEIDPLHLWASLFLLFLILTIVDRHEHPPDFRNSKKKNEKRCSLKNRWKKDQRSWFTKKVAENTRGKDGDIKYFYILFSRYVLLFLYRQFFLEMTSTIQRAGHKSSSSFAGLFLAKNGITVQKLQSTCPFLVQFNIMFIVIRN